MDCGIDRMKVMVKLHILSWSCVSMGRLVLLFISEIDV